jgi:hypothetical protein
MIRRRRRTSDQTLRGRIGAYRLHALHDSLVTTAKARKAFLDSFEVQVDPDGVLTLEERRRRATAARRAHFIRLARLSAISRRAQRPLG